MDDRRRGLEEEYFHRKNQEAIEKLRQKMAIAEEAKAAGTSSMACPRCDGALKESEVEGVLIDTCARCAGVWLDASELERLSKLERPRGAWLNGLWELLAGE
jgi:hypothetical protein